MERLLCLVSVMDTGGAETFLMKLYRKIDRTKYQMDFCVNTNEKGFYDDEIKSMGGKIYVIPCKTKNYIHFKKKLSEIIIDNNYDHVLRIASNYMGFMDLKVAKKAGAKKCIARSSNSSEGGGVKSEVANYLGRIFYDRSIDIKIAPSKKAALHTFGKRAYEDGQVFLLHNALDLGYYKFSAFARSEIRNSFSVGEDTILIGHIGRFSKQKNHTFLIDIFQTIYSYNKNTALLLVGSGELERQIRDSVHACGLDNAVIFAGTRSDIPDILSAMDVFLFPSLYEGMPNTVIEAQATGLPCVISDTITDEANVTGLVHFVGLGDSADDWAKAVFSVVPQGRENTEKIMTERGYSIDGEVERFLNLIF